MLRSKAADCTVIGKGEAEWSLRDNIVGDSAAAASASVLGIRKRSNSSYVRTYVYYNFGVGIRGNRALLCYSHTTKTVRTYVRHDEFAHKVRNIHKDFFVNSQWYERASETFAGLPVGRLARSFYTVTTYDVCMYVVAVDNESKLFYCMMTLTA